MPGVSKLGNNELYRGIYRWNRTSTKRNPVTGKVKRIKNPKEEWVETILPHLRIVPDDLWFKVKARQKVVASIARKNFAKAKSHYSPNLFTGLIQCGVCGGNIVVVQGGKKKKYGCSTYWNKGELACNNSLKIPKEILWKEIYRNLKIDLTSKDKVYILNKVNNMIQEEYKKRNQNTQIEWIKKELAKTEKELKNIIEAIKAGIITETTKEMLIQTENRKKMLTEELNKALKYKPKIPILTMQTLDNYLNNLPELLEKYSTIGREVIKTCIGNATLYPLNNGQYKLEFANKIELKEAA